MLIDRQQRNSACRLRCWNLHAHCFFFFKNHTTHRASVLFLQPWQICPIPKQPLILWQWMGTIFFSNFRPRSRVYCKYAIVWDKSTLKRLRSFPLNSAPLGWWCMFTFNMISKEEYVCLETGVLSNLLIILVPLLSLISSFKN